MARASNVHWSATTQHEINTLNRRKTSYRLKLCKTKQWKVGLTSEKNRNWLRSFSVWWNLFQLDWMNGWIDEWDNWINELADGFNEWIDGWMVMKKCVDELGGFLRFLCLHILYHSKISSPPLEFSTCICIQICIQIGTCVCTCTSSFWSKCFAKFFWHITTVVIFFSWTNQAERMINLKSLIEQPTRRRYGIRTSGFCFVLTRHEWVIQ